MLPPTRLISLSMRDHARILTIAAREAIGEPDTIERRPEVIDSLMALAGDPALPEATQRVAPGRLNDPGSEMRRLAEDLTPYRDRRLDDAPELVERLLFVAWLLNEAVKDDQPTSEIPALTTV